MQYMRPLSIWAMQWALSPPKLHNKHLEINRDEEAQNPHLEFSRIARLLKLPEEKDTKSIYRVILDIAREKFWTR